MSCQVFKCLPQVIVSQIHTCLLAFVRRSMHTPAAVCHVHAATSVFMLVPAVEAARHNPVFAAALVAGCLASLVHWANFKHNSARHWVDRCCSAAVLVCACVQRPGLLPAVPVLGLVFLRGRSHYFADQPTAAARWHTMFRYLAFWLCYVHASGSVGVYSVVAYSVAYAVCVKDLFE